MVRCSCCARRRGWDWLATMMLARAALADQVRAIAPSTGAMPDVDLESDIDAGWAGLARAAERLIEDLGRAIAGVQARSDFCADG